MTTIKTRLDITSWDEKPYRELPDGRRFTRADVVLGGGENGVELEATWEALLYYGPDGHSTFSGLLHATGTVDGRQGSFVLRGNGTYDGTTARIEATVVPGSGTDELSGLTGTATHESTKEDYPHWPMVFTFDR